MTGKRYTELNVDQNLKLTDQEKADGWHFCKEWDGMLIHKDWPESKGCICEGR